MITKLMPRRIPDYPDAFVGWVRNLIIKNLECKYSTKILSKKNENKELVLWETNNNFSLNKIKILKKFERNIIKISKFNKSIIIGLILSDGYIEKRKGWNPRIIFEQSIKNFEYIWYIFNKFNHFNSTYPKLRLIYIKNKIYHSILFKTRQLFCFNEIYNLFYSNNKKIIKEDLYHYIDYISIAHWIMGDGSKRKNGLILCTDNFTLKEIIILMNIFKIKFNIDSTIQKEKFYFRIYINKNNIDKIKPNIKPYFVKSMLYKIL